MSEKKDDIILQQPKFNILLFNTLYHLAKGKTKNGQRGDNEYISTYYVLASIFLYANLYVHDRQTLSLKAMSITTNDNSAHDKWRKSATLK